MAKYELLSGEKINLKTLKRDEQKKIKSLETCIKECENHNREDYLNVYHTLDKIKEGKNYTARRLAELYNSDFYRVANDIIKRYWYRCFSGDEHFEEYIQKEGLTEEYTKYKTTGGK